MRPLLRAAHDSRASSCSLARNSCQRRSSCAASAAATAWLARGQEATYLRPPPPSRAQRQRRLGPTCRDSTSIINLIHDRAPASYRGLLSVAPGSDVLVPLVPVAENSAPEAGAGAAAADARMSRDRRPVLVPAPTPTPGTGLPWPLALLPPDAAASPALRPVTTLDTQLSFIRGAAEPALGGAHTQLAPRRRRSLGALAARRFRGPPSPTPSPLDLVITARSSVGAYSARPTWRVSLTALHSRNLLACALLLLCQRCYTLPVFSSLCLLSVFSLLSSLFFAPVVSVFCARARPRQCKNVRSRPCAFLSRP